MTFGEKTNKNWYPYKKEGCYFKLVKGVLRFAPMNLDGSIDKEEDGKINWGEVDWESMKNEWYTPTKTVAERDEEIGYELSVKI